MIRPEATRWQPFSGERCVLSARDGGDSPALCAGHRVRYDARAGAWEHRVPGSITFVPVSRAIVHLVLSNGGTMG